MKKAIAVLLCLAMAAGLCACGASGSEAMTREVSSELYTQEEIQAAINVITKEFQRNWKGCTLLEIYYAGDDVTAAHEEFAEQYKADEVIVLRSSFEVDATGGANGSLNPNSVYERWNWILVRTNGGRWKHVDHGY